jgi:lysophospholipase L1-like esterase
VLLVFPAAELVCRFLVPSSLETLFERRRERIRVNGMEDLAELLVPDAAVCWRLDRGLESRPVRSSIFGDRLEFTASTNRLGLRGRDPDLAHASLRVLALGDPCTFSVGVEDAETYPALTQEALRAKEDLPDVVVLNAGVPGDTAYQGRRLLEELADDLEPNVVTVCFGFNDAVPWDGRSDPDQARILAGDPVDRWLQSSRLYVALRSLLLRSGREPAAPSPDASTPRRPRLTKGEFLGELHAIREFCRERGIPVVFVIWPYRDQILDGQQQLFLYQTDVAQVARSSGATLVNLVPAFLRASRNGESLFVDHIHASPAGNALPASVLIQALGPILRARAARN